MQRRRLGLFAVVVTALGSAGCGPRWIGQAMFMSSQTGESVLVKASAGGFRVSYLRKHSLENGALLASVRFLHEESRSYQAQCEPAAPGRLWCLENGSDPLFGNGLRVRDAESLQIIADQDRILGGTPELARERPFRTMRVDPKTRGFVFEARDGYAWIIDPITLVPTRSDRTVGSIPAPDQRPPPTGYELIGGTRKTLVRNGVALHPEHTYLNGEVVMSLDDPPRVLVLERVLDHGPTLWCLFADGTTQWKVTSFSDSELDTVRSTKLYRDMVVLVTATVLVALRTQDGAVVWSSPP